MDANNVVDFTERWLKREQTKEELENDQFEDLHDICTLVANDALDALRYEYDIDVDQLEFSPEMIFFFEAFKALILKSQDYWHPFQDYAQAFFEANKISVRLGDDGNYHFVIGDEDEQPSNDS